MTNEVECYECGHQFPSSELVKLGIEDAFTDRWGCPHCRSERFADIELVEFEKSLEEV